MLIGVWGIIKAMLVPARMAGAAWSVVVWMVTTKAGRITALALAVGIAFLWYGNSREQQGREAVTTEINKQNERATGNATGYRRTRMECVARGGVFDFAKGTCDR